MPPWRIIGAALALIASTQTLAAEWGRNATLTPGWERIRQSAMNAARHPMTWAPTTAGLLLLASGRDETLAENIYETSPVFGTPHDADAQSDRYRLAADVLWMASMALTDSGTEDPWHNKAKGALVQVAAVNTTYFVTNRLKYRVDRAEPSSRIDDGLEAEGNAFPSNHATGAFAHATLIRENMRDSALPRPVAATYVAAGYIAASGSAWGRIEAGAHHVSDQLIGAAIGNFMAMFINDAFMGEDSVFGIAYAPHEQAWTFGLTVGF